MRLWVIVKTFLLIQYVTHKKPESPRLVTVLLVYGGVIEARPLLSVSNAHLLLSGGQAPGCDSDGIEQARVSDMWWYV